ncbi:hypothetical protein Tco_1029559 [Tanacetum coccineum]|uniref:Uncharacterized protein n=1 Tax=Tanacetum coccineum TaxID=301880 RepID=A0ABQ5G3S6_9ASTR
MDDPHITMEEYIRLKEEKAQRHGRTFNWQTATFALLCKPMVSPLNNNEVDFKISFDESNDEDYMNDKVNTPSSPSPEPMIGYIDGLEFFKDFKNEYPAIAFNDDLKSKSDPLIEPSVLEDMKPLPSRDQRNPWIRYQVKGYDEDIVHSYEHRLKTIWGRDEGQELFTSHTWKRLFEIRAPLVREFILEFLSTCRMSDTYMRLDVTDTLCFQLGGARRRMTWRQFILALGLHTEEEIAEAGFGAYWDFLGPALSYVFIRDPMRRLCHRMIAYNISGRGQAPKKYLFRHAKGRKSGARLSKGHFIGRLIAYFGLVNDQGLRG